MKKNVFLISFLPAIAYWYLESNYSLKIALIGGGCLAILEILFEKIFLKHIHTISKFNCFLILGLGSISYFAQEGIWYKLQPFFTGMIMGGWLLWRSLKGKSLMEEMMTEAHIKQVGQKTMLILERDMSVFLIIYGLFMAFIAFTQDTARWLFFKTAGFYIASFLFFIVEFILMRKRVAVR